MKYLPGYITAQRLGISGQLLGRITGVVYVSRGSKENPGNGNKINVALNLKNNKKNTETAGYTKKEDDQWKYSSKALQAVADYIQE